MSLLEEQRDREPESGYPSPRYPYCDSFDYLPRYAPMGPYHVSQNQMLECLMQLPPTYQTSPPPWGFDPDFNHAQFWPQLFQSPLLSEGATPYAPPTYDQPMLDGPAQFSSSHTFSPIPPPAPDNITQSRITIQRSIIVRGNRTSPETILHNTQASSAVHKPSKEKQKVCDKNSPKPLLDPETGKVTAYKGSFGSKRAVRRRLSDEGRKNADRMRKVGACASCRQSKRKCNLGFVKARYESCEACVRSTLFNKQSIYRMPCFESQIFDAVFFRLAPSLESPHRSTMRKEIYANQDISHPYNPARRIEFTQGIENRNSMLLKVTLSVSEFVPDRLDKTAYMWKDAEGPHVLSMPPFCISHVGDAKHIIKQYVRDSRNHYISKILKRANRITQFHFFAAHQFEKKNPNSLVGLALDLWSASRVIEESWTICGSDTLGVEPIEDPANSWYQKVPVTPIMDTQLDQLVIKEVLTPLKEKLLKRLQDTIENFQRERWFEIYLALFVLLSTIEAAAAHQRRFAVKYGLRSRFANHKEMEEFFHGSQTLLAHFHHMCRGALPIQSLNWRDPKIVKFAQLDDHQAHFMENVQKLIRKWEQQLLTLRLKHKYDKWGYWSHQLFFDKWKPGPKSIQEEIP